MAKKPMVVIDFGEGNGTKAFSSGSAVAAFFEGEFDYWTWVDTQVVSNAYPKVAKHVRTTLNTIRGRLNTDVTDDSVSSEFVAVVEHLFANNRLPISDSLSGTFLGELQKESVQTAAAALSTYVGNMDLNFNVYENVRGAVLMVAAREGMSPETPATVKKALERITKSQSKLHDEMVEKVKEVNDRAIGYRARLLKLLLRTLHKHKDDISLQHDLFLSEKNQIIADLKSTDELYKEHMKLKSPVQYWTEKCLEHKDQAERIKSAIFGFAFLAGIALVAALCYIAFYVNTYVTADKPTFVLVGPAALGIILTTMAFWPARILTRLFLSEHHLAVDARERAMMAQTYLALIAEGAASDTDRSLVLGALFRPTEDGIVKDDGAPDISPAAFLSKVGTKASS